MRTTSHSRLSRQPATAIALGLVMIGGLATAPQASASSVGLLGGELRIIGDMDADAITVSTDGTTITVSDTGTGGIAPFDATCAAVNAQTATCPALAPGGDPVEDFEVDLYNGIDSFVNENLFTSFGFVRSNDGMGRPASGAKTITGGPGIQLIDGGTGNDSIDGGAGDDRLYDGGGYADAPTGGNDLLVGGAGADEVNYFRITPAPLAISLDGAANDGQAGEADNVQVEHVSGGNGDDVLIGDSSANSLTGVGGSDLLVGLGGNDELFGEFEFVGAGRRGTPGVPGNDTLDGGAGRDGLECGPGIDIALSEPADTVRNDCERTGALVVGDSAQLRGKKKNKFKAELLCPESEGESCSGKLKVTASGKKLGKGKFSIGAGKTQGANAKLTKKGVKAVNRAGGSLLVTVEATTNEPGGTTLDKGTILVHR